MIEWQRRVGVVIVTGVVWRAWSLFIKARRMPAAAAPRPTRLFRANRNSHNVLDETAGIRATGPAKQCVPGAGHLAGTIRDSEMRSPNIVRPIQLLSLFHSIDRRSREP